MNLTVSSIIPRTLPRHFSNERCNSGSKQQNATTILPLALRTAEHQDNHNNPTKHAKLSSVSVIHVSAMSSSDHAQPGGCVER